MRPLMLTQITRVRTAKVAEPALVNLDLKMQRTDMRLQLRMRRRRIPALIALVRLVSRMGPLVVVLGLVRRERLVAVGIAAGVWPVTCVAEEMP